MINHACVLRDDSLVIMEWTRELLTRERYPCIDCVANSVTQPCEKSLDFLAISIICTQSLTIVSSCNSADIHFLFGKGSRTCKASRPCRHTTCSSFTCRTDTMDAVKYFPDPLIADHTNHDYLIWTGQRESSCDWVKQSRDQFHVTDMAVTSSDLRTAVRICSWSLFGWSFVRVLCTREHVPMNRTVRQELDAGVSTAGRGTSW